MISIFEKVRLPQLRKEKYSILASMLHIFLKFLSYRASYLLLQYFGFLISCFESGNIFQIV